MMKKFMFILLLATLVVIPGNDAGAVLIGGVEFPDGPVSFADAVFSFNRGTSVSDANADATKALGIPDNSYLSLGNQGSVTLRFTDNSLTTSGSNAMDLWIFEIGDVENMRVSISTDGTTFIPVGDVSGQPTGIDIDAYIGSGVQLGALYTYVRIVDLAPNTTSFPTAGADIDAVGAISSAPPPPGVPEPATMLLLGSGLVGVLGFRRRFKK